MKPISMLQLICLVILLSFGLSLRTANAQGTPADYERAKSLKSKYEGAAIDIAGPATWIGNSNRFWYRKLSKGQNEFIVFDAQNLQKQPAFDHSKIAASLSKLTGTTYKAQDLPLGGLRFDNNGSAFFVTVDGISVRCTVSDSVCARVDTPPRGQRPQGPVLSPDGKWDALINICLLLPRQL